MCEAGQSGPRVSAPLATRHQACDKLSIFLSEDNLQCQRLDSIASPLRPSKLANPDLELSFKSS